MVGPLKIPPELKKINQFIRRAEELDKDTTRPESRLVAYYCRQYAVHVGIPFANTAPAKQCLGAILNELESEKKAMSTFTKVEAEYLIRKFANVVFDRADEEDRNGTATKNTAKTFYAAATFYEVLQQFYKSEDEQDETKKEQHEEDVNKRKYSKWKATEILKALKEGTKVTPGGYGEMEAVQEQMKDISKEEETVAAAEAPSSLTTSNHDDDVVGLPPAAPSDSPMRTSILSSSSENGHVNDDGIEVVRNASNSFRDGDDDLVVLPPPPSAPTTDHDDNEELPPPPKYSSSSATMKMHSIAASISDSVSSALGSTSVKHDIVQPNHTGEVTKNDIDDAIELTRFAIVSFQSSSKDGMELGAQRIIEALGCLGKHTQPMTTSPKASGVKKCLEQLEKAIKYLRKNDAAEGEKRLASALACLR